MKDQFENAKEVIPNDSKGIKDERTNGSMLYIGVEGDLKVKTISGDTITLKNHPVGYVPCRVVQVFATGTTADKIVALW